MSKVNIDVEKINNELIPSSKSLLSSIKSTYSKSLGISFPEGDYGWNNAISRLDDCVEMTDKYVNWINSIYEGYNKAFTDGVESISSNKIGEVTKIDNM